MNEYLIAVFIVGAFSLGWFGAKLGYWALDQLFGSRPEQAAELQEFIRTFSGRCPVCSYYEYGVSHGYVSMPHTRPLHYCIQNPPEGRTCNDLRN